MIYLDNSATTKVLDCALNAAVDAMTENFGNPAAVHSFGKKANDILENARKDIMAALNVKKGTLVFTSGGTESINWAISFAADKNKHKVQDYVLSGAGIYKITSNNRLGALPGMQRSFVLPYGKNIISPWIYE